VKLNIEAFMIELQFVKFVPLSMSLRPTTASLFRNYSCKWLRLWHWRWQACTQSELPTPYYLQQVSSLSIYFILLFNRITLFKIYSIFKTRT